MEVELPSPESFRINADFVLLDRFDVELRKSVFGGDGICCRGTWRGIFQRLGTRFVNKIMLTLCIAPQKPGRAEKRPKTVTGYGEADATEEVG